MEWFVRFLSLFIANVTPELRKTMQESINAWETQARQTDNPWDDLAVLIVKGLFNL